MSTVNTKSKQRVSKPKVEKRKGSCNPRTESRRIAEIMMDTMSRTTVDSKAFWQLYKKLPANMRKLRFVPRCLHILEHGFAGYVQSKKVEIAHLQKSIANDDEKQKSNYNVATLDSIDIMENLLKSTFQTFQTQILALSSTLEKHTSDLHNRDIEMHPNLLRKLPDCLRGHVFSFLQIGYRFEPILIRTICYKILWCIFNSHSNLFEVYSDFKKTSKQLLFDCDAMAFSAWYDNQPRGTRFYWWSEHKQFTDGFIGKENSPSNNQTEVSSRAFIQALATLQSKTQRVPKCWQYKSLAFSKDYKRRKQAKKDAFELSLQSMRNTQPLATPTPIPI